MTNEEQLKLLRLGFSMHRALEKALDEINEIISEAMNELEKLFDKKEKTINKMRKEEETRKKQWEIRESIDQWQRKD